MRSARQSQSSAGAPSGIRATLASAHAPMRGADEQGAIPLVSSTPSERTCWGTWRCSGRRLVPRREGRAQLGESFQQHGIVFAPIHQRLHVRVRCRDRLHHQESGRSSEGLAPLHLFLQRLLHRLTVRQQGPPFRNTTAPDSLSRRQRRIHGVMLLPGWLTIHTSQKFFVVVLQLSLQRCNIQYECNMKYHDASYIALFQCFVQTVGYPEVFQSC